MPKKLEDLDVLLMSLRREKISAEQCWGLITDLNLWPDAGELLLQWLDGRDVARTRANLADTPETFRDHHSALLAAAETGGAIKFDDRRFLEGLFPVKEQEQA